MERCPRRERRRGHPAPPPGAGTTSTVPCIPVGEVAAQVARELDGARRRRVEPQLRQPHLVGHPLPCRHPSAGRRARGRRRVRSGRSSTPCPPPAGRARPRSAGARPPLPACRLPVRGQDPHRYPWIVGPDRGHDRRAVPGTLPKSEARCASNPSAMNTGLRSASRHMRVATPTGGGCAAAASTTRSTAAAPRNRIELAGGGRAATRTTRTDPARGATSGARPTRRAAQRPPPPTRRARVSRIAPPRRHVCTPPADTATGRRP
jgi:hypothetical protein